MDIRKYGYFLVVMTGVEITLQQNNIDFKVQLVESFWILRLFSVQ